MKAIDKMLGGFAKMSEKIASKSTCESWAWSYMPEKPASMTEKENDSE